MTWINRIKKWKSQQPILAAASLYLALGYALYFAALSVAQPPVLVLEWIEEMKPFIKSLHTASRVAAVRNETAFPAQIVIVYCTFGMVLLAAWAAWSSTDAQFRAKFRANAITVFAKGGYSRFRLVFAGTILLALPVFFALVFFFMDTKVISWRDHVNFSSSLQSASFLLFSSAVAGLGVYFVIPLFESVWKGPRNSSVKN